MRSQNQDSQYGLVYFSDIGQTAFNLNTHSNRGRLLQAIANVPYVGANTNTSGGLKEALRQFTPQNGDRSEYPNVVIVITDGASTFDRSQTVPAAEALHAAGITVFAIGVTRNINATELRLISSPPRIENQNFFRSADFSQVNQIVSQLSEQVCPTPPPSGTLIYS